MQLTQQPYNAYDYKGKYQTLGHARISGKTGKCESRYFEKSKCYIWNTIASKRCCTGRFDNVKPRSFSVLNQPVNNSINDNRSSRDMKYPSWCGAKLGQNPKFASNNGG